MFRGAAISAHHLPHTARVRRADDRITALYECELHRRRLFCGARRRNGWAVGNQHRHAVHPADDRARDHARHGWQCPRRGAAWRRKAPSCAGEFLPARPRLRHSQHAYRCAWAELPAPDPLLLRRGRCPLSALRSVRRASLHLDTAHDGRADPRHLPRCGGAAASRDALLPRRRHCQYGARLHPPLRSRLGA